MKAKQLTFLFADLVGSTKYKESHNFESSWKKTKTHNKLIIDQVVKRKGTIFKLLGDGVLAYWEGDPTNDCNSCLEAALDALLAVSKFNQSHGLMEPAKESERISTRIGIAMGPVKTYVYKDYHDYVGERVDIAARLSSMALPDSVLLDDMVANTITKQHFFHRYGNPNLFEGLLEKERVKGKIQPIDVLIIGADDLQGGANKGRYPEQYKSHRSLEGIIYVAVGGFMRSHKSAVASKIATKLGGYCITDKGADNPYLDKLWSSKGRDRVLATQTNVWHFCHQHKVLEVGFEQRKRYDSFVSDFHIDHNLHYSAADGAMDDLIFDVHRLVTTATSYKRPDFLVLLEAPPDYYFQSRNRKNGKLEEKLSEEYYRNLVANYHRWKATALNGIKHHVVETDAMFHNGRQVEETADGLAEAIVGKMKSHQLC